MKVNYDIHCHTYLSVCAQESATIDYYVSTAEKLGLDTIGIADHLWDAKIPFTDSMRNSLFAQDGEFVIDWYKAQDVDHCRQIKEVIKNTDTRGIKFLFGGEVEYCPGVGPAISEDRVEELDFMIVPNSHCHHLMYRYLYEPYEKHAEFMLNAIFEICKSPLSKYVTSLAHPFVPVECPYPDEYVVDAITDAQLKEAFSAAKEAGIAVEINTSCLNNKTDEEIKNHWQLRILGAARDCGCKFTFGSDSHYAGYQDTFVPHEQLVAKYLGLTDADILDISNIVPKD